MKKKKKKFRTEKNKIKRKKDWPVEQIEYGKEFSMMGPVRSWARASTKKKKRKKKKQFSEHQIPVMWIRQGQFLDSSRVYYFWESKQASSAANGPVLVPQTPILSQAQL